MKLFSLLVLYKGETAGHVLKSAFDLANFSFFQRGSVQEFITFTSKILTERTEIGERQSVKEGEYSCHVYCRSDSLVGVCVSDHHYPNRVAHTLLTKILDDFTTQIPRSQWSAGNEVAGYVGVLDSFLKKFQANFSFFQRGSVQEFITFTSKILTERTEIGERQSVKEGEYSCHVYCRSDSLVGVCVSDHHYPNRVAHTLLTKILDDFTTQDPAQADPMMKVQNELDETKIILHSTIEAVLQRGEKLDDLVAKSEGLSMQSKTFYKTAKKTNSCCASWS